MEHLDKQKTRMTARLFNELVAVEKQLNGVINAAIFIGGLDTLADETETYLTAINKFLDTHTLNIEKEKQKNET